MQGNVLKTAEMVGIRILPKSIPSDTSTSVVYTETQTFSAYNGNHICI